ncbi:hypothetical protein Mapa_007448 [Marchantia paleacea]|nr:hypothetical protein Mapa_007448 [Marchantia paleacea]
MAAASPSVLIPTSSIFRKGTKGTIDRKKHSNSAVSLKFRAHQDSDSKRIDDLSVKVSRRWAALVLPVSTALGVVVASPGNSLAAEEQIQCVDGNCGKVVLRTLSGCGLGVARYPDFVYNADGGGGSGVSQELADGRTFVRFDPDQLKIPPVSMLTTTLLGLPLPPFLKIEIVPKTLEGYLERSTGKVELQFLANFYFTVGTLYSAPPLVVNTVLTTEAVQGALRGGKGKRLDSYGNCQLVGVALVEPVDDLFMNTFLTLPTDCLAEMAAQITFI